MALNIGTRVTYNFDNTRYGVVMAYNRKGKVFVRWLDDNDTITIEKEPDLQPLATDNAVKEASA